MNPESTLKFSVRPSPPFLKKVAVQALVLNTRTVCFFSLGLICGVLFRNFRKKKFRSRAHVLVFFKSKAGSVTGKKRGRF